ncbi:hypothetical protein [Nocardioides sp. Root140]|uniref:hypothetical protein n=1 Tax=Nocardioides sp. Root140 TaxID=1736460 RepID=UPI0006FD4409|nr:hypothetical protein [Nocardioides sp. Root140]KQY56686.1 hypothetical protein ASD30_10250 [Nocardioides sp. Root140]
MNDNTAPYGAQQQPSYDGTQGTHTMGQQWMQPQPAKKPAWYKRTWVIALAVGFVCLGLGAASAGTTDVTTTSEYKSVVDQRDAARSVLSDTETELATSKTDLTTAQADLETIAGEIPAREAAVTEAEASVKAREAAVTKKEKSVGKREKAVGLVEQTIANNTLSGDGIWEVGADIKAGTYKTIGGSQCYYAVLNSTDTSDIADNNNVSGPAILSVSDGQYLELSGCGDWVWQR